MTEILTHVYNISFSEAVASRCSVKASNFFKKETLTQVFSCEICEILKNIFFIEQVRWLLLALTLTQCKLIQHYMTNIPKNVLTSSAQYFENINYRIVDRGEYKSFTSSRKYVSFQRVKLPENLNVNPLPPRRFLAHNLTAQKSKVSIKDFFSNCDQIRSPFFVQ